MSRPRPPAVTAAVCAMVFTGLLWGALWRDALRAWCGSTAHNTAPDDWRGAETKAETIH